jgi:hypothetical protein
MLSWEGHSTTFDGCLSGFVLVVFASFVWFVADGRNVKIHVPRTLLHNFSVDSFEFELVNVPVPRMYPGM